MADVEDAMDFRIAFKIDRNRGLCRPFAHFKVFVDIDIEFEAAEVIGEHQQAVGRQSTHAGADQVAVVTLEVEVLCLGRVRERRRIAEDQLEALRLGGQIAQGVSLDKTMRLTTESVRREVVGGPIEIGR